jgi:hypothetical protein
LFLEKEKQSWGEMETFAEYSGDSAYSWGGKRMLRISAAQKLKWNSVLRGIIRVNTGYDQ